MNGTIESVIDQVSPQIEESPYKNLLVGALKTSIDKQKANIEELLIAKKSGELTQKEFEVELTREKQIVEAEMLTWQITAKSEVQRLVNKTFHLLVETCLAD